MIGVHNKQAVGVKKSNLEGQKKFDPKAKWLSLIEKAKGLQGPDHDAGIWGLIFGKDLFPTSARYIKQRNFYANAQSYSSRSSERSKNSFAKKWHSRWESAETKL